MKNRQYAYTSAGDLYLGKEEKPGWLPVKNGLTIAQTVEERVKQQDIASTTSNLVIVDQFVVPDNTDTKLDDKIREILHTMDNFQNFVRDTGKNNEWTWVKISDIIDDLNTKTVVPYDKSLFENKLFLDALQKRIRLGKQLALAKMNYQITNNITLRPHQQKMVNDMMDNKDKEGMLLSLAPRFGKTFTVLEYVAKRAKEIDNLVLLIASKNLSSNNSFEVDYKTGGYAVTSNFTLETGSLFKNEDQIIKKLDKVLLNKKVILVTDEADIGSHTEISTSKLEEIKTRYDVIQNIAMSGTGIYKAAKILSDIDESKIFKTSVDYTELLKVGGDVVGRNFKNIQLTPLTKDDVQFNIRESISDDWAREHLAEYLHLFIDDRRTKTSLSLLDSDVMMVFTSADTNKNFSLFVDEYQRQQPQIETMKINGRFTTNGKAESLVKAKLHSMRQNGINKKLVIFSNGMASRSFSIPEINRVIVLKDNEITSSDYQKFSRSLTFQKGKMEADIIRISFENVQLAEDVFMHEAEQHVIDDLYNQTDIVTEFLDVNSFAEYELNARGKVTKVTTQKDAMKFIDRVMEYNNSIKYLVARLFGTGIIPEEFKSGAVVMHSLGEAPAGPSKVTPSKGTKKNLNYSKAPKENEKKLKNYLEVVSMVPYSARIAGFETIQEFIDSARWLDFLPLSPTLFLKNFALPEFKIQMEAGMRFVNNLSQDEFGEFLCNRAAYLDITA